MLISMGVEPSETLHYCASALMNQSSEEALHWQTNGYRFRGNGGSILMLPQVQ